MKILYITAEGFDTPNPNNQMAELMIKEFLNHGHSVHLIQSHRKGINQDIPLSISNMDGFTRDTIVRNKVDKRNFVRRYLNEFRYAFSALRFWRKVKNVDVVYVQSNPTIVYTLFLLKIFKKAPIVFSIYDVFPGHAHSIGVIKNKLIYNTLKILQKPCYYLANAITVLSEDMKDKVVIEGAKPEKVYVVPAWFDDKSMREIPISENRFIKKYNIALDKFYVQFAGTVGYVFNYKTIIELAKRLKGHPEIIIQIIGDGNVKDRFTNEATTLGLANIIFYPLQPVELVPDVYSACNICIIPLQQGVIGNGVPSKAPLLMACKRVIVNSLELDSKYAQMFIENEIGVAVDISDYDGLTEAIIDLRNNPAKMTEMAEKSYVFGQAHYSSTQSIKKLISIFKGIVK